MTAGRCWNTSIAAELQGVIGHEFSHILNGDMRLNIRLMGLLFGLLVIAIAGRTVSWYAPRRVSGRRGGGVGLLVLAGFAVMVLGYIGVFFGRLIQAAVSRQREILADASSVQFTRDTTGLRNALVKIGSVQGSRIRHPDAEEVAHMLFAPGMTRWFATHPPLVERIRALDPSFDPAEFRNLRLEVKPQPLGVVDVVTDGARAAVLLGPGGARARSSCDWTRARFPGLVGNPGTAEVHQAQAAAAVAAAATGCPAATAPAAPLRCCSRWCWTRRPAVRAVQLHRIRAAMGEDARESGSTNRSAACRAAAAGAEAAAARRDRARRCGKLPAETRAAAFSTASAALCRADGEIAIFEYALANAGADLPRRGLEPRRRPRGCPAAGRDDRNAGAVLGAGRPRSRRCDGCASWLTRTASRRLGLAKMPPFRPLPGWASALDRALRCLDGLAGRRKNRGSSRAWRRP